MKLLLSSLLLLILVNDQCLAQLEAAAMRDEAYYLFPIKPGVRNTLAGTMGELRSTHFHSGIDIRTEGRTGLTVHAAAMGYISRAVVSSSGYGNTLYIKHPNGHTTVYAHLEKFVGPIADFVRREQYRRKTYRVDLSLYKGQFIVAKGDTIAYSGNSGSSGGPHLHFDIRDENQNPLNPLTYGFDEVLDRIPPVAENIVARSLDINSRVSEEFGQKRFRLKRIGNNYVLTQPIKAYGTIGLMLDAYDKLDYSRFRCGINTILVDVNGGRTFESRIKSFSFAEQRNIYQHMSYEDSKQAGERYHKLYLDDGNKLNFYTTSESKGKLFIEAGKQYDVKITMIDTYGNRSFISFKIEGTLPKKQLPVYTASSFEETIFENTLKLNVPKQQMGQGITLNGSTLQPSYYTASSAVFLHDLSKELPKVLEVNNEFITYPFKDAIAEGAPYTYYDERLDVYFQRESIFDTLYFKTDYKVDSLTDQEQWIVGDWLNPLRKSIKITLKPEENYDQSKYSVYATDNFKNYYYEGGTWDGDRISFWTGYFGKFTILADSTPPRVTPIRVNKDYLRFMISDDLSGIASFNCYVNNQWVLMNYDHKQRVIWSEKLDESVPFEGEVELIVSDNVNNETIYTSTLKP